MTPDPSPPPCDPEVASAAAIGDVDADFTPLQMSPLALLRTVGVLVAGAAGAAFFEPLTAARALVAGLGREATVAPPVGAALTVGALL